MASLSKILAISQSILNYSALAMAAVGAVQAEVGASAGAAGVQQTKKQLAVAYVLAAAHAGESLPVAQVQQIAAIVDMQATLAKALGLFGKVADSAATVVVPK